MAIICSVSFFTRRRRDGWHAQQQEIFNVRVFPSLSFRLKTGQWEQHLFRQPPGVAWFCGHKQDQFEYISIPIILLLWPHQAHLMWRRYLVRIQPAVARCLVNLWQFVQARNRIVFPPRWKLDTKEIAKAITTISSASLGFQETPDQRLEADDND